LYTVKLNIEDSVFDKVIYFLKNLPSNEVSIVEEKKIIDKSIGCLDKSDTSAFSDHSANLIEDWKDSSEDDVWR
jgi:hypothetical protein